MAQSKSEVKEEMRQQVEEEEVGTCPQCDSSKLVRDYQQGTLICENCGYILKEDIEDTGPEWRAFSEEQREKRDRSGPPMTYTIHDKGLSTAIDWRNRDSHGKELTPSRRAQMYRLRKWQKRIRVSNSTERNLAFAFSEVGRMASQLGIPRNVREETAILYRRAVEERVNRGRSMEGLAAATLYAACRKLGVPRTLKEIEEASRVDKKEIGRSYRFIARELDMHLPPTSPVSYVSRFGSELELSSGTQSRAIELIEKAEEKRLTSGRNPISIAAAAIYIASVITGEHRTQRHVADVAHVTEVTIRNRYMELVDELDLDVGL